MAAIWVKVSDTASDSVVKFRSHDTAREFTVSLNTITNKITYLKKGKNIPATGRGGPKFCERSRLSHYLDKRLTDGGDVVSLTPRPPFTPRKILATHLC
jgi:hypothetical protein